jgi:hypothetical protein
LDVDGDRIPVEDYDYDALVRYVDALYPKRFCDGDLVCEPGANNRAFHAVAGQDSWITGPRGIQYDYIMGAQNIGKGTTFGGYRAIRVRQIAQDGTWHDAAYLKAMWTYGDGTVPLVSARRAAFLAQPDGESVTLHLFTEWSPEKIGAVDHTKMTKNPAIQDLVLRLLRGESSQAAQAVNTNPMASAGAAAPAYYVTVLGGGGAYATNDLGQITGRLPDGRYAADAAEVQYTDLGTDAFALALPAAATYTVTFYSLAQPAYIEVTREAEGAPDYTARVQDLTLPAGTVVELRLSPLGLDSLQYDSNGDGTADQPPAQAPAVAQGRAAADTQPPTVTLSVSADRVVTVNARDDAGVHAIYCSFDGGPVTTYTGALAAPPTAAVVEAFADDSLLNRSPLVTATLPAPAGTLITSTPVTYARVGQTYRYQAAATGSGVTFELLEHPAGMVVGSETGLVEWTPAAVGAYPVVLRAAAPFAPPGQQSFVIYVDVAPQAAQITSSPVTAATVGASYRYDVDAAGIPPAWYALVAAPEGMVVELASGLITWAPAAAGDYAVTVQATNGFGAAAEQSFTIRVTEDAPVSRKSLYLPLLRR